MIELSLPKLETQKKAFAAAKQFKVRSIQDAAKIANDIKEIT